MTPPRLLPTLLALALAGTLLGACGSSSQSGAGTASPAQTTGTAAIHRNAANAKVSLVVGSKNFTEQRVLAEIYAQGLRAAGYDARTKLDVGDQNMALAALRAGQIDAYPEYTGTALLNFFGVKPDALPRDPQDAYRETRQGFAKEGLVAFPPTPFTSSNEVAVTKETAKKLSLQNISDLSGDASNLTLAGPRECRRRPDCLLGLEHVYGLRFGTFLVIPIGDRHTVLTSGKADVSIVFTTDPQIQRESEVLLEDDRKMFPPYNSTFVVRKEVAARAGADLPRTLRLLQARLTDENMQELNARVDLDGQQPAAVARAYLTENGLLPPS